MDRYASVTSEKMYAPHPAGAATSAPVRQTVSSLIGDFDPVLKRASDYAHKLQNIRDRVVGVAPTGDEQGAKDTGSDCLMSAVRNRRETLVEILDRMEYALNTLDDSI